MKDSALLYVRPNVWIGATLAFLMLLLLGNYVEQPWFAGLSKAAASTCFITVALTRSALSTTYGRFILSGLVLSWFGDVFLIGSAEPLFLAGLASFLLGHVAYAAAFLVFGIRIVWSILAAILLGPVVFLVLHWLMPHVEGAMRVPVAAYIVVITLMVLFAWGARGNHAHFSVPVGAMLFFFSDIAVARARFVEPGSMDWLWGLPLYYGGQLFLAYSAGTVKPALKPEELSP